MCLVARLFVCVIVRLYKFVFFVIWFGQLPHGLGWVIALGLELLRGGIAKRTKYC